MKRTLCFVKDKVQFFIKKICVIDILTNDMNYCYYDLVTHYQEMCLLCCLTLETYRQRQRRFEPFISLCKIKSLNNKQPNFYST